MNDITTLTVGKPDGTLDDFLPTANTNDGLIDPQSVITSPQQTEAVLVDAAQSSVESVSEPAMSTQPNQNEVNADTTDQPEAFGQSEGMSMGDLFRTAIKEEGAGDVDLAGLSEYMQKRYGKQRETQPKKKAVKTETSSAKNDEGFEDLQPEYDENEIIESNNEEPIPDVDYDQDDDYDVPDIMDELPIVKQAEITPRPILFIRTPLDNNSTVTLKRHGLSPNAGADAFANYLARWKQDTFGKITVPMVNSGFVANVTGMGITDFRALYTNVNQNTNRYDYVLEQMSTIIRNISGTTPKIAPHELARRIHYADYNMLSFGVVCATLNEISYEVECENCGRRFVVKASPADMLLNNDTIEARREAIMQASDPSDVSYFGRDFYLPVPYGKIHICQPSYQEAVNTMRSYQNLRRDRNSFKNTMRQLDWETLDNMVDILLYIKDIEMNDVDKTKASTLFQKYKTLITLSDDEQLRQLGEVIAPIQEDQVDPEIGFRNVTCPYCGNVKDKYQISSMLELVFFHFQALDAIRQRNKTSAAGSGD